MDTDTLNPQDTALGTDLFPNPTTSPRSPEFPGEGASPALQLQTSFAGRGLVPFSTRIFMFFHLRLILNPILSLPSFLVLLLVGFFLGLVVLGGRGGGCGLLCFGLVLDSECAAFVPALSLALIL